MVNKDFINSFRGKVCRIRYFSHKFRDGTFTSILYSTFTTIIDCDDDFVYIASPRRHEKKMIKLKDVVELWELPKEMVDIE